MPNARVQAAMNTRCHPNERPLALSQLRDIPNGGIVWLGSWSTLRHDLYKDRQTEIQTQDPDTVLQHMLPDPPEKGGGHVKLNRFMEVSGSKYDRFEDCLPISPRRRQMEHVVDSLTPLIQKRQSTATTTATLVALDSQIRQCLAPLQKDNYSSYVRPTVCDLADAAVDLLGRLIQNESTAKVIATEKVTMNAIQQIHPEWYDVNIDTRNLVSCLPNGQLDLMRSHKGHLIIVMASPFIPWAENVQTESRFRNVGAAIAFLELMAASGNNSREHFQHQYKLLRSFLMGLSLNDDDYSHLEKDSSQFLKSRINTFPVGYFPKAPKRSLIVSQPLQIGCNETLMLRKLLGRDRFNTLLRAHGLLRHENQIESPMEPLYQCPGLARVGTLFERPCVTPSSVIDLLGSGNPQHPLYGDCACNNCVRRGSIREHHYLSNKSSRDQAEDARLAVLEKQKDDHRQREEARLQNNIQSKGQVETLIEKSIKDRKYNSKRAPRNPTRTSKPIPRAMKTNKQYPLWFQNLMRVSLRLLIEKCGEDNIRWEFVIQLWEMFLEREEAKFPAGIRVPRAEDNRHKYYLPAYVAIRKEFLDDPDRSGRCFFLSVYQQPAATMAANEKIREKIQQNALVASGYDRSAGKQKRVTKQQKIAPFLRHIVELTYKEVNANANSNGRRP
jgi:hypothetical protein